MNEFSGYIHIPWCIRKCPYCDFNIHVARPVPEERYTKALIKELQKRAQEPDWKGRPLRSIYFGGGTPSVISPAAIKEIIDSFRGCFNFEKGGEIALEANPEDVSGELFAELKSAGVNRASLGAQSFSEPLLRRIGRRHTGKQAVDAVSAAKAAGIENINIDLIFGIPGQTLKDFHEDLLKALETAPSHFSLYGLTVEEGTPFFRDQADGKLVLPDEETFVSMMELGAETLTEQGFIHYEISNFARPGFESIHNLCYWNGGDYLGIGAGAHSFIRADSPRRWGNFTEPARYMERLERGESARSWEERLSEHEARFEFFFMGLRKLEGVLIDDYRRLFGRSLVEDYEDVIEPLIFSGLIAQDDEKVQLTWKGILVADSVIEQFANV